MRSPSSGGCAYPTPSGSRRWRPRQGNCWHATETSEGRSRPQRARDRRKGPARSRNRARKAKPAARGEMNILAQENRMRGRPPYEPTQKDRDFVIATVEHGANHDEIAAVIGVSDETLRRHCGFELQRGLIKAHADVARTLLMRAVGGPTRDEGKRHRADLLREDAHEVRRARQRDRDPDLPTRATVTGNSTFYLSGSSLEEAGAFLKAKRKLRQNGFLGLGSRLGVEDVPGF